MGLAVPVITKGLTFWSWHTLTSVQFSRSVMSDSLWPHGLQHARPPYPSPAPGIHSDSCSSSQWCHPAISFSVIPFSSFPQSLPASEYFPMSQLFAWGGQNTGVGVSALASVLPKKSQGWSPSVGINKGKRRRGWQRMRWLNSITNSMDMNLSKRQETVKDKEDWHAAVHRVAKNRTPLSNWTTTDIKYWNTSYD